MDTYPGFQPTRLDSLLSGIRNTRTGLIGDLCLDVYWLADMTKSELSRETPHFPLPIVKEWMSPGGGGNTAANMAALRPGSLQVFGVLGKDWRGDVLGRLLRDSGMDTGSIIVSQHAVTNAYCKPLRAGYSRIPTEDPRLDFNNDGPLSPEDEASLLESLIRCASGLDVLCVSDQLTYGCITPQVREKVMDLAREGLRVVVDSRDRIRLYRDVVLKPNEVEVVRALGMAPSSIPLGMDDYVRAAVRLARETRSSVCMTLGEKGCVCVDDTSILQVPAREVPPPIDIVGAGDTFLSAFSCALAAGAPIHEAAWFANLAASITIRKINITGTASPEEIRNIL